MSIWQTCALTDVGARRKHNEDAIMARPEAGLWVVADGMGGHEAGDKASNMIASALSELQRPENFSVFVDRIEDALQNVNVTIRDHAAREYDGRMMGSTVVAMAAGGGYGACIWAGDSRLYRLRGSELHQVSRDHSQVQKLVDAGVLSAEEAESHPNANVITRAIGGAAHLAVDVAMFDILPGDRIMLCSDGLYNEVANSDIARLMGQGTVDEAARGLLDAALAGEARDNISVIVVEAGS